MGLDVFLNENLQTTDFIGIEKKIKILKGVIREIDSQLESRNEITDAGPLKLKKKLKLQELHFYKEIQQKDVYIEQLLGIITKLKNQVNELQSKLKEKN